jgi:hypothetical protein
LHHDPAIQAINHFGSQRFQACDLGRNIVSLNVDVNPTLVFDALNLHNRFIWRRFQHTVVAAGPWMIEIYRTAQRISPKLCGLINIRCAAIN